jgi:hypothetical protein
LLDVLQTYEGHREGWCEWTDRVFYKQANEEVLSLRQIWGSDLPAPVRVFDRATRFFGSTGIRNAIRVASSRMAQPVS